MNKLTPKEENELTYFIKDWLKVHGYSQKDLAANLNIKSSRTSELIKKFREIHKRGGFFTVAKKLIEVEQKWLRNSSSMKNQSKDNYINNNLRNDFEKPKGEYSQLDLDYKVDIDLLIDRMEKDFKE